VTVKSPGIVLDKRLGFDKHVDDVCKTCYWHIRAFRHVRDSLPDEVAKAVAHSIVDSLLDYCNALYAVMSEVNLLKLQRVQNALARVTMRKRKCEHITRTLTELYRLSIKQRITFRLASITLKTLHTCQPGYLHNLLHFYAPARNLRSSSQGLLLVSRTRTVLASRGFRHSAVSAWNDLPAHIRDVSTISSFKHNLNTFVFTAALTN